MPHSARIAAVVLYGLAPLIAAGCGAAGEPHVAMIVEERLADSLSDAIAQFRLDLAREGVTLLVVDSLTADTSPQSIRQLLERTASSVPLQGAILVGEFSAILFNQPAQQGDPYWHDHLADLYFMDLDGYWADIDANGVFETHLDRESGVGWPWLGGADREPEIWVSRLRTGSLPGVGSEVELLRAYFAKNHAYRSEESPDAAPRTFLVGAGVDLPNSDWGARPEALYGPDQIDAVICTDSSLISLRRFLSSGEPYELGVINVFSGPRIHHFGVHEGDGYDPYWDRWTEGRRAITERFSDSVHAEDDVTWKDVLDWQPKVRFYQILSSETGRHDERDYLAGAYVFTGDGLAAIAGTQHSGAMGTPQLYGDLAAGYTIGEAWRRALAFELGEAGEPARLAWCDGGIVEEPYGVWPAKAVLVGDGTLRLRGGAAVEPE